MAVNTSKIPNRYITQVKRSRTATPAKMNTPRMRIAPRMPQKSTLRWYRRAMPSEPKISRNTKRLSMLSDSSMR